MARQGVAEARGLLRALLVGRFVFTPVTPPPGLPPRKGPGRKPRFIYELRGEATLSGLIAGLILQVRWWPQRDSNPCFSLERAVSWASRRWGRPIDGEWLGEEGSNPHYRGQNPASYH
jgi:hypothetical protein